MKDKYIALLSMVIGWNILSYWTGIHWIGYVALTIGFIGIISENFTNRLINITHGIFRIVFQFVQKIFLSILYFIVITPIALIKRKNQKTQDTWFTPEKKELQQFEKLW